jgi:hypothetical protein
VNSVDRRLLYGIGIIAIVVGAVIFFQYQEPTGREPTGEIEPEQPIQFTQGEYVNLTRSRFQVVIETGNEEVQVTPENLNLQPVLSNYNALMFEQAIERVPKVQKILDISGWMATTSYRNYIKRSVGRIDLQPGDIVRVSYDFSAIDPILVSTINLEFNQGCCATYHRIYLSEANNYIEYTIPNAVWLDHIRLTFTYRGSAVRITVDHLEIIRPAN